MDGTRSGAIWVTATGALLLLSAAVTFVAVRWDRLGPEIRLSIILAATGAALVSGRTFRRALPATSSVLTHLGAFLVPVDVTAFGVHEGLRWPAIVLADGAALVAVATALRRSSRSPLLRAAQGAGLLALGLGGGAHLGLPVALVLVAMGIVAELAGRALTAPDGGRPTGDPTVLLGTIGGFLPAVALVGRAVGLRHEVLDSLAIPAAAPPATPAAIGSAAAVVLACAAHRHRRLTEAALGLGAAALGVIGSVVALRPDAGILWVAAALAFLVVELVAARAAHDPFWGRSILVTARFVEVVVALASTVLAAATLAVPLVDGHRPAIATGSAATAGVLAVVAWLVADQRRRVPDRTPGWIALLVGGGWEPTAPAVAVSAVTAVAWATWSSSALAIALVLLAAVAVCSARPFAHGIATIAVVAAPVLAFHDLALLALTGGGGALVLAWAASLRLRTRRDDAGVRAAGLAAAALLPLAVAVPLAISSGADATVALVLAAAVAWLTGVITDPASEAGGEAAPAAAGPVPPTWIPWIGRIGSLATFAAADRLRPLEAATIAVALTAITLADAVITRRPGIAHLLGVTVPVAVATAFLAAGHGIHETGVALAVTAVLAAGAALVPSDRWRSPAMATALSCAIAGLALAGGRNDTLGTTLLLLGGIAAAGGIRTRAPAVLVSGCGIATVGVWCHLTFAHITASDAYAAPVAVLLLVAGVTGRRSVRADGGTLSSWVAFGPAIAALGVTALLERIDGGGGAHAVVLGAVAVGSVLAGGARRLAAPLLLGSVLLGAGVWHELLGVEVGVPTWAWLAGAGALLVAAGILLERHETTPLETGRRLVDTISERYE